MPPAKRPKSVDCEDCGEKFDVAPRGPVPSKCPDCRKAPAEDEPAAGDREGESADPADPSPSPVTLSPTKVVPYAVWDGNLDAVRAILDDGVEIDVHRADGPSCAEVHGPDRDWFVDVRPGNKVYADGQVVR